MDLPEQPTCYSAILFRAITNNNLTKCQQLKFNFLSLKSKISFSLNCNFAFSILTWFSNTGPRVINRTQIYRMVCQSFKAASWSSSPPFPTTTNIHQPGGGASNPLFSINNTIVMTARLLDLFA